MSQLDELEAEARAATIGPWVYSESKSGVSLVMSGEYYDAVWICEDSPYNQCAPQKKDMKYIAAASPNVILKLIARIRHAERIIGCYTDDPVAKQRNNVYLREWSKKC